MTLVLSVNGRRSMWLVVDRRLSYGGRRRPIDDAVKVMNLETADGVGLVAYAGLGATAQGTQPSNWMSAVLRGRGGLSFEQALGLLASAANRELPKHLATMPGGAHFIIVSAFIRGVGFRLYSIDNVIDDKSGQHRYRYLRIQRTGIPGSPSPRLAVGGTGGIYLAEKEPGWQRALLRLVSAHDHGKVSDHLIADQLARLNYEAHQQVRDGSVGPRCIVVWRLRPRDRRAASGGGSHQFYTGVDRDQNSDAIPTIANGMDVKSIAGLFMKQLRGSHPALSTGVTLEIDEAELNRLLATLPSEPDETLR